ncbi:MAG: hypothetical protein PHO37_06135 [Kiritimatiellae bacterium]|nr:hypothetical protein [Kiritimatiellia bacterium]
MGEIIMAKELKQGGVDLTRSVSQLDLLLAPHAAVIHQVSSATNLSTAASNVIQRLDGRSLSVDFTGSVDEELPLFYDNFEFSVFVR